MAHLGGPHVDPLRTSAGCVACDTALTNHSYNFDCGNPDVEETALYLLPRATTTREPRIPQRSRSLGPPCNIAWMSTQGCRANGYKLEFNGDETEICAAVDISELTQKSVGTARRITGPMIPGNVCSLTRLLYSILEDLWRGSGELQNLLHGCDDELAHGVGKHDQSHGLRLLENRWYRKFRTVFTIHSEEKATTHGRQSASSTSP